MLSDQNIAKYAIQNAMKEMRGGNRQAARSWAHIAVSLAPKMEEAWLILSELAGPRASFEYFKEALRINPGSQRAQQGLWKAQNRLQGTRQFHTLQSRLPRSTNKTRFPILKRLEIFSASMLVVTAMVTIQIFASHSGYAKQNLTNFR